MNWKEELDKDTIRFFSIIIDFLVMHFNHKKTDANEMFDSFLIETISTIEPEHLEDHIDHVFHHDGAWNAALRIQYKYLGGNQYMDWFEFKDKYPEPHAAWVYFREKYYGLK